MKRRRLSPNSIDAERFFGHHRQVDVLALIARRPKSSHTNSRERSVDRILIPVLAARVAEPPTRRRLNTVMRNAGPEKCDSPYSGSPRTEIAIALPAYFSGLSPQKIPSSGSIQVAAPEIHIHNKAD